MSIEKPASAREKTRSASAQTRAERALAILAAAQDGALGAGLPAGFDIVRQRWGALSPPASAYGARMLANARLASVPGWPARRARLLGWLAGVQRHDGLIQGTTLAEPRRPGCLTSTGNALVAWCRAYRDDPDPRLARAIQRAAAPVAELLTVDSLDQRCAQDGVMHARYLSGAEGAFGLCLAGHISDQADWRDIARRYIEHELAVCTEHGPETFGDASYIRGLAALLEAALLCQTQQAIERVGLAFTKASTSYHSRWLVRGVAPIDDIAAAAVLGRRLATLGAQTVFPRRIRSIVRRAESVKIDHDLACTSVCDLYGLAMAWRST